MKPTFDVLEPRDCPAVHAPLHHVVPPHAPHPFHVALPHLPRHLPAAALAHAPRPAPTATARFFVGAGWNPRIPATVDWAAGLPFGMMLNDQLGDCGAAVVGHTEEVWNYRAGHPWIPSDDAVRTFYFQTSVNHQDLGAYTYSTIAGWAGQGIAGHRIARFTPINWHNHQRLRSAIWTTEGGVYLGINLPQTAIDQFRAGQPWTTVTTVGAGAPGSAGAHAIELTGYNAYNDTYTAVTWGREIVVSGDFINNYVVEAWAVAGGDMFGRGGRAANGMNMAQVNRAFATLGVA